MIEIVFCAHKIDSVYAIYVKRERRDFLARR